MISSNLWQLYRHHEIYFTALQFILHSTIPLLHGAVGIWDEVGTIVAIFSFIVLMSFLAWSNGNKRRKAQAKRRRKRADIADTTEYD